MGSPIRKSQASDRPKGVFEAILIFATVFLAYVVSQGCGRPKGSFRGSVSLLGCSLCVQYPGLPA